MDANEQTEGREAVAEYVRMYYEHQYDRIAQLEQQRLSITSIVITLSTVALTFGFSDAKELNLITGIGLPIVVFASNLLAIAHILRSADWIELHRNRAKQVLELYARDVFERVDKPRLWPAHRGKSWWRRLWARWRVQLYIHILLMLVAVLIPVYLYWLRWAI